MLLEHTPGEQCMPVEIGRRTTLISTATNSKEMFRGEAGFLFLAYVKFLVPAPAKYSFGGERTVVKKCILELTNMNKNWYLD
eukprot:SAG31_NODE_875_length_11316_cov_8.924044_5_plen_82_part_00